MGTAAPKPLAKVKCTETPTKKRKAWRQREKMRRRQEREREAIRAARDPRWQRLHDDLTRLWVGDWISFRQAQTADRKLRAMEAAGHAVPAKIEDVLT